MRRAARPVLYLGIVAVVLGLSKIHAALHRQPALRLPRLQPVRLGAGLHRAAGPGRLRARPARPAPHRPPGPDHRGRRRGRRARSASRWCSCWWATPCCPASWCSARPSCWCPWYLACAALATDAGARAAGRDRVLVVSDTASATRAAPGDRAAAPSGRPGWWRVTPVAEVEPTGIGRPAAARARPARAGRRWSCSTARPRRRRRSWPRWPRLHQAGTRVRTLSLFYEEWLGMLPVAELERVSLLFDIGELHRGRYGRVKRIIDFALALVGAAVRGAGRRPGCSSGNLIANRGSLLLPPGPGGQERRAVPHLQVPHHAGRARAARPTSGRARTIRASPRSVACCGVTHLDELPQVLNILKGDLAMVGPRPEQPHYVDELREKLPFYDVRHLVRPGPDRLGPGEVRLRRRRARRAREAAVRVLLPAPPVARARPAHRGPHHPQRARPRGRWRAGARLSSRGAASSRPYT